MSFKLTRALSILLFAPFLMGTTSICDSTRHELAQLHSESMLFLAIHRRCPETVNELDQMSDSKMYRRKGMDYWGNEFHFESISDSGGEEICLVMSLGPDGKIGGGDDIYHDGCEAPSYSVNSGCSFIW